MKSTLTDQLKALLCHVAIHNNEESYKQLFQQLFNPLFRLSFAMLKNREQAEEVASDVMFRIWQNRIELLEVENLKVYALTMARNMSLNMLKKNARTRMVFLQYPGVTNEDHSPTPDQLLIQQQNHELLYKSVQALPTRCRLIFKLIKEEGLSYKEVAEVLNISPKTVDAHLVTAMKKLAEALKQKSL